MATVSVVLYKRHGVSNPASFTPPVSSANCCANCCDNSVDAYRKSLVGSSPRTSSADLFAPKPRPDLHKYVHSLSAKSTIPSLQYIALNKARMSKYSGSLRSNFFAVAIAKSTLPVWNAANA